MLRYSTDLYLWLACNRALSLVCCWISRRTGVLHERGISSSLCSRRGHCHEVCILRSNASQPLHHRRHGLPRVFVRRAWPGRSALLRSARVWASHAVSSVRSHSTVLWPPVVLQSRLLLPQRYTASNQIRYGFLERIYNVSSNALE